MVILGGLELVAAGYVLHELRKDEEKPRSSDPERRRRHRHNSHSHSHHRRDSDNRPRPPRPDALAPPKMAPVRPNSAPPQQTFPPPRPGGGPYPPGPWMNQMPIQQQQNPPFQQIPHPQTWPHPSSGGPNPQGPPNPSRPMYLASDFPPNPHLQQQQQQQMPPQMQVYPPPPGPGNLPHRPTMHLDLKTGKWQSDMLPPEMPRTGSAPVGGPISRDRSASLQPPSRLREERRRGDSSSDSYSSGSDSSGDENLAYGSLPGERRRRRRVSSSMQRIVSRERQRPQPVPQSGRDRYGVDWNGRTASKPVELPNQMRYELQ